MAYFQMFSLTLCMLGNLSCICCCQRFSFFKINLFVCSIALLPVDIITCVTLAKAGLVIGQLPPSICPSACPSASLLGCLVCVICNSNKSFHSFIFKLCKMAYWRCAPTFLCTFHEYFFQVLGVLNLDIFPSKMLWWCLNRVICNLPTFFMSLLAHLSRRLMGELIVYQSLRRPSVRLSSVVRLSTFSNIFFSENHWANWTQISYGESLGQGNESLFKWSWSHDQDGRHAHIW